MKTFAIALVSILAAGAVAAPAVSAAPSTTKPFTASMDGVRLDVLPKGKLEIGVAKPGRVGGVPAVWVLCEKPGECFLRAPQLLGDKSWRQLPKGAVRVNAPRVGAPAFGEASAKVSVKVGSGKTRTVADLQDAESYAQALRKDKPSLNRVGFFGPIGKPLPAGTQVTVDFDFKPVTAVPSGYEYYLY